MPEAISYQESLLGTYTDKAGATWIISSAEADFNKQNALTEEDRKHFEAYKGSYVIEYQLKGEKADFIGMPFLVNGQLLLDCVPVNFNCNGAGIADQHLLPTHSVAKLEMGPSNTLKIDFMDEDRVDELLKNGQLRIEHSKIGLLETLVLTAKSEQLYRFLERYLEADIEDKWNSKNFELSKVDEKS
ncbi:hypothetical protein B7P33_06960 [Sediminicola luteus]|uniref:Uncharacterized protein n=1 Tax=Sediminicola luteus TaxID=319238 RepID=A0A2A4GA88_9FLAO|nr:hypothetical protein B7P33_06960 [Sediminicola luteus]